MIHKPIINHYIPIIHHYIPIINHYGSHCAPKHKKKQVPQLRDHLLRLQELLELSHGHGLFCHKKERFNGKILG